MRFLSFCVLVLFANLAFAQPVAVEYDLSVTGEIVIDPEGRVSSYTFDEPPPEGVAKLVHDSVAGWRFEPILTEDGPVTARTRMTLNLVATKQQDESFLLRVGSAHFGGAKSRGTRAPPHYPAQGLAAGVGARVLMILRLDPAGNVVDVHPYQTSLTHRGTPSQVRGLRRHFEHAVRVAVKRWTFTPGENIGGTVLHSSVMVPVVFSIKREDRPQSEHGWVGYVPGPISPPPWVEGPALASVDTDALQDGAATGIESRFRLISDVIGKNL